MLNRTNVDAVKEMVRGTRCLDKLLDAICDTIYLHADSCAEDFGVDKEVLQVALEEIVYNTTYTDEDLAIRSEE